MNSYIVVWGHEYDTMASVVELPHDKNPEELEVTDWIRLAAEVEGCDEKETASIIEDGMALHAVVKGTAELLII